MKASIAQINYLNIFLILVSCVLAYILPFELFLFAYAVLGPLHYLTEISWLHERQYFTTGKWDFLFLGILTLGMTLSYLVPYLQDHPTPGWASWNTYIAFFSAPLLVLIKEWKLKIFGCIVVIASTYFLFSDPDDYASKWVLFLVILLPTIIHVYVFTGAFMVYGAMKEKGYTGFLSILFFIVCSVIYFIYQPDTGYTISEKAKELYTNNPFTATNYALFKFFNFDYNNGYYTMFYSKTGIAIMRFIAFVYTYHYLNWFSKTTIIGWHKQSKLRLGIIGAIWVFSVVLYAYNYNVGFKWLFALSFLHVYLEFPLNYKTFISIGQGIGNAFAGKKSHG